MDDLVGTLIGGKYRLNKLLGEGGMGAVYAALQEGLNRRCAVKVLHSALSQDGQLVARFKQEAEVAASMGHPNIVQVTDFGFEDGRVFLVMDLLDGEPLADAIEQGVMSADRVRFIATQVLSALQAAHDRQIVHRDLKPDNIFLTSLSGVRDVVKLLDFGIARMTGEQSQKMTTTGQVLGTPAYMSPEQARGKKVDPRTDLYSLGVLMYEALSGRMPVSGENYHELMFNIVGETPMPLKELRPDLPPGLLDVVAKAMEKDLAHRYQTAREMHDALQALGPIAVSAPPAVRVAADPPLEGPETLPDAFAKTATPAAVSAVQIPETRLVPESAVGANATIQPSATPTTDSTLAPVSDERHGPWLALAAVAATLLLVGGGVWAFTRAAEPEPVAMNAPPDEERERVSQALAEATKALNGTRHALDEQVAQNAQHAEPDTEPAADSSDTTSNSTESAMHPQVGGADMTSASTMTSMTAMASMTSMASVAQMQADAEPSNMTGSVMSPYSMFASVAPGRRAGPDDWHDWSGIPIVWQTCGRGDRQSTREVYPVMANTRLKYGGSSGNHVVATDQIRAAVARWAPGITRCYRGHTVMRGQNWDITIDESGTVTGVRPFVYCPVAPAVRRCVEQLIMGETLPPDQNAPGDFRFNTSVEGA